MSLRTNCAAGVIAGVLVAGGVAFAQTPDEDYGGVERVRATPTGWQENPPISTTARGRFRATVRDARIQWELEYDRIEGGRVTQAHIHFAPRRVNGGISVWLCGNLPATPAGVQACPQRGTISGVARAADVIGPAGQGIAPGQFRELRRAIRRGFTYATVHSETFPGGEIRGQIRPRGQRR